MSDTPITEFVSCLGTISHARAGWDYYDMPAAQRAEESRQEKAALAKARAIWAANPDQHDDLRAAFVKASPLATISEIAAA